jgi:hypothetical protein
MTRAAGQRSRSLSRWVLGIGLAGVGGIRWAYKCDISSSKDWTSIFAFSIFCRTAWCSRGDLFAHILWQRKTAIGTRIRWGAAGSYVLETS